ncbi:amidohydrolase family protein [Nocardioides sp. J54]|uniref:amidohydrolase family protein n=1 Tax=Nocardioides sp. J54 TaxID=935866 RepID=UPI0004B05E95|nr:amidohydrolase family protein [Nocardioides sp. J54]
MTDQPPTSQQVLDQLRERPEADRAILFTGGTVLTLDPRIGDLAKGDVLVRGRRIEAVGPDLSDRAGDAVVVDATGRIVLPGFQDTHRHCWQGQMRRLIPDCDNNSAYLVVMNEWLGTVYEPHDIYVGNLISSLGALDAGITSMLDFFHNPRTPEHSDAAIEALTASGIRAVHTSCGPIAGESDGSWPGDVARLRDRYFSSDDQLLTLRMGTIGAAFANPQIALGVDRVRHARELGISLTSDGIAGIEASNRVLELAEAGLLDENVALIHCLDIQPEAWQAIADHGVNVSIPTTSDATIGIWDSVPAVQKALDVGIRPSLSVDVEAVLSPDMFTQMRTLLNIQRMMVFARRHEGETDHPAPLTNRDVLEMATIEGARFNGTLDRTGTLTPGKRADLIMVTADDWNTLPLNNAVGTVVTAADTRNVEAVFVDGQVRKWAHSLVDHDLRQVRELVERSRDSVMQTAGFDLDVLEQKVGFMAKPR